MSWCVMVYHRAMTTTHSSSTYNPANYTRSACGQGFVWRADADRPGWSEIVMASDPDYAFAHSLTYVEAPEGHRLYRTVNFIPEGTA